ncbi:GNAT family N-acetyltransferase [Desulfotignum phosphitoxidans]|jgi:ribosomal protein S18 acetylase RimI-like enzyme|uniref:Putative acetyltransferase, GNAT-family protein n=1 Tax=Desulfotignum phosphitoxidans DSM 13687 TaxID=1286635 RepID=S0G230_9BACT|nr:GNAT family N-acetyltransferase [Desulfotignum phosphitoxidans]EMS79539.1 putative acetyltransferase, GNAT-family protein [Desulfotignum phosphitoxidans DSM 13687]
MTRFRDLVIAPLNSDHDRAGFHCHVDTFDHYIHKQAGQDIKRSISRIFVAEQSGNSKEMLGYYSLSTLSIELSQLPENLARKLPRHPIPAALIGRLAVSKNAQGYGIGRMLLIDAIKRTLSVSDQIAIYAMIVDAVNDSARGFYEQYGFASLKDSGTRLFLPLKSFKKNPDYR